MGGQWKLGGWEAPPPPHPHPPTPRQIEHWPIYYCGHINTWYLLRLNLNVTVDAICHWHVQIKLRSSANAIYLLDWMVASVINNINIRCNWCLLPILTLLTYAAMLCRWSFHKPVHAGVYALLPISAGKASYKYWLIFIYQLKWLWAWFAHHIQTNCFSPVEHIEITWKKLHYTSQWCS